MHSAERVQPVDAKPHNTQRLNLAAAFGVTTHGPRPSAPIEVSVTSALATPQRPGEGKRGQGCYTHVGDLRAAGDHALALHGVHVADVLVGQRVAAAAHVRAALDWAVYDAVARAHHDVPRAIASAAPAEIHSVPGDGFSAEDGQSSTEMTGLSALHWLMQVRQRDDGGAGGGHVP